MLTSTETGRRRSQIFCRMREFTGSREAIPRVCLSAGGPQPFTETGGEVPNHVAKGSDTSATRVSRLLPAALEAPGSLAVEASAQARASLFDFGKERLETPTLGVSIFGQPGLEQTQKTKSVVHLQHRVTPRAVVQLMRDRWVQISEAIEYHLEGKSQPRGVIFISLAPHWPPAYRRGGGVHRQCQQDSPLFGPLHRATTSGNAAACDTVTFSPYFREPPTS